MTLEQIFAEEAAINSRLLHELRSIFREGPRAHEVVKVHIEEHYDKVTVTIHEDLTVNFELFKRLSALLLTENIDVEQESGVDRISEVTSESWSNVTFTARKVPLYLQAALQRALREEFNPKPQPQP